MDTLQNSTAGTGTRSLTLFRRPWASFTSSTSLSHPSMQLPSSLSSNAWYDFCCNSLIMELDNMIKLSEKCNIQIPTEVLNLIDDGKNLDEFTRDVLNSCIAKNQITKGKTDGFKSLRKHLLEELEQTFPDEVESYREIRASSAARLGRFLDTRGVLSWSA